MTVITSAENSSQPPMVPSVWNHLTSTVAINAWLGNVRNWQGQNPELKVIPVQIAYTDRAQKQKYEHRAITLGVETDATSDQLKPGHEDVDSYAAAGTIALWRHELNCPAVALTASCLNILTGLWHASALVKLGQQIYIYSSTFAPKHWTIARPRMRELEGMSIPRHFIQLHKYRFIDKVWVTGTGSNKLSCLPESAKFVRDVVADSAGITTEGPMPVMGGRYEWVRVRLW